MADENKKVEYKFTGDVKSLHKAVESAISLLDTYQKKVDSIGEAATAPAQQISAKLKGPLKQVMGEVDKLQKKFKELQGNKVFQNSLAANQMASAMQMLQQQLTTFQSRSKVTTTDVKELANAVQNTKTAFADAGPQVDALVQKEQKFQDKLQAIRNKSAEMAEAMRNAFGGLASNFDGAASKLESFKAKASETIDHTRQMIEAAGSGFRRFTGDAEAAGAASVSAAEGEAAVAEGAAAIDPKVAIAIKAVQAFKKALEGLLRICKSLVKTGFETFKRALGSLTSKMNSSTGSTRSFAKLLGGLGIGSALSAATKSAIALVENLNLFTVAMGDSVDEADAFITKMSEIYGMDPSNLYRYSGYFYQLTDAVGTTAEASKVMSLSLTKAANDISSLFNQKIETVVNDLASGMQGMSRAVRKYGVDIRQATLKQTALNYGFTENIATTSEANRQALRYLTIMHQVKNATQQVTSTVDGANTVMGDFARNIETPANQLRILKEQASQLARAFGTFFIPIMQKVLYVVNGVLMALKTLFQFIASLAGIEIEGFGGEVSKGVDAANDLADSVGGVGDAADKTTKKLKNMIAPFDELTILTQAADNASSGLDGLGGDFLDPSLAAAIEAMELGLDDIRMKALDIRDKLLDLLGLSLEDGEIKVKVGGFIDDLLKLWDAEDFFGFGKRIAEFLNQGIAWGIEHTDPAKYADMLNKKVRILAEILNGFVAGLDWEGLGTIIGNGITLALGMIDTFLKTFDFRAFGAALGTGLMGIVKAVDWDLLGDTIGNYFKAKIEFGLGFIDAIDWLYLGAKVAQGLTAMVNAIPWDDLGLLFAHAITDIFDFIKGFVEGDSRYGIPGFDFIGLGKKLGNGLMTMIRSVDWEDCGRTLGKLFNGLIDTIKSFLDTYEWGSIGSAIAQHINGIIREINWHNLGVTISDTIRSLLREVTNFLGELDWFSIGKAIAEFILAIDWFGLLTDVVVAVINILGEIVRGLLGLIVGIFTGIGKDITDGFKNGILDGLKNIAQWLKEHLVDPVVRAVKGFLGIHSPSTVFAEIGGNVIAGFLEGILKALSNIATWIRTNIVDPIVNTVKSGFGITGAVSSVFVNIGSSIVNGFMNGLQTIGSQLSEWGASLKNTIQGIFDGISNTVSSAVNGIKSAANNVATKVSDTAKSVANSFNNMMTQGNKAATQTKTTVSTPSNNLRKMASGGVVRGPTQALIGEGKYNEAVIPLGDSPELAEMIDKIAAAVSTPARSRDADRPLEVHVYLDGSEITAYQNRTNRMYGRTQQNI